MTFRKRGKYERFDAVVPIEIHFTAQPPLAKTPATHTVLCDNIGDKGFRFVFERELTAGMPLEITLHLPDDQPPLRTKGEVVWVREAKQMAESPKSRFDVGVAFSDLSFQGKDRIHQYIYRRLRHQDHQDSE